MKNVLIVIVEPINIGYTKFNLFELKSRLNTLHLTALNTPQAIIAENNGDKNQDKTIPPTQPT